MRSLGFSAAAAAAAARMPNGKLGGYYPSVEDLIAILPKQINTQCLNAEREGERGTPFAPAPQTWMDRKMLMGIYEPGYRT